MSIIDSFDRSTLERLRTAQGRTEWIEEQADLVAEKMIEAMGRIVRDALENFAATLPTITAAGDFTTLDVIPTQWSQAVESVMPNIEGMYLGGSLNAFTIAADRAGSIPDAFTSSWLKVTNTEAANYIASAQNKIVGAGEDVWRSVKVDTAKAVAQGIPTEELKAQIEKTTGYSEFRADTIARTETHRAFEAGNFTANQNLGQYGATHKEWLATGDSRTRQTHLDAMALGPIPYDQPFLVGEDELMYPGDESGSPGEVINCRCTLLEYFPGDEASDGSIIPGEDFLETEEYAALAEPEPVYTAKEQRVIEAAEKYGVTPDEVRTAQPYAEELKSRMRAEAAQIQHETLTQLAWNDMMRIQKPSASSSIDYDWFKRLHPKEQARLRKNYMGSGPDIKTIDVLAEEARERGLVTTALQDQDVITEWWLEQTRKADAAGAVARGFVPVKERYTFRFAIENVAPTVEAEGYRVWEVLTLRGEELAAYVASVDSGRMVDAALDVLEDAATATLGPPPYRMSFQAWDAEVQDLLYQRTTLAGWSPDQVRRYAELVPEKIDAISETWEDVYSLTIETARQARLEVADYARIPWQD